MIIRKPLLAHMVHRHDRNSGVAKLVSGLGQDTTMQYDMTTRFRKPSEEYELDGHGQVQAPEIDSYGQALKECFHQRGQPGPPEYMAFCIQTSWTPDVPYGPR